MTENYHHPERGGRNVVSVRIALGEKIYRVTVDEGTLVYTEYSADECRCMTRKNGHTFKGNMKEKPRVFLETAKRIFL